MNMVPGTIYEHDRKTVMYKHCQKLSNPRVYILRYANKYATLQINIPMYQNYLYNIL